MPVYNGNGNTDVASLISAELARIDERIRIANANAEKRKGLETAIENCKNSIAAATYVNDSLGPLIKDIEAFAAQKREVSLAALNRALNFAAEVIPEAEAGSHFVLEANTAHIETARGTRTNKAEGSGYKGVASTFCRSFVLEANPTKLQTLFLDEVLSKVSDENSVGMSQALPIIAQTQQVFMIEQKKEVFAAMDVTRYKFSKEGTYTTVVKEQ